MLERHPPGCHCCEGQQPRDPIHNAPGLPALAWRIDTHPGFAARMLTSLPLWRTPEATDPEAAARPLARLTTRAPDDPAVALVDAAACVADVLGFYQERIANEGFLRTATERRSVLELARAVGYELRPGVAASVHLVFTVEDAPGAPGVSTIPAGSPVQSVPPQDKLPQVFETEATLLARAEWNALRPRLTRAADLALLQVDGAQRLALLLPAGSLPASTDGLHPGLAPGDLFRLDPGLPVEPEVEALEIARTYLGDQASGLAPGELLLFVGKRGTELQHLVLRVRAVEEEPALRRLRVELEPLPDPVQPAAPPLLHWTLPLLSSPFGSFGQAHIANLAFTSENIASTIVQQSWQESELQAMIAIQGWSSLQLVQAITAGTQPAARPVAPEAGAFSFGARLGFFGHNAPRWDTLPAENLKGNAYPEGWDEGDGASEDDDGLAATRSIWEDSQGRDHLTSTRHPPCHALLERPVLRLAPGSWMVFDSPSVAAATYPLFDARETARADFGLSGRAMALRLATGGGQPLAALPAQDFKFRDTTAHVASRRQPLAELPIEQAVAAGSRRIELSGMVLGLARGKPLAFVGPRDDLPGVQAAEIALLDDVVHGAGRSTLVLQQPLVHNYQREGLRIHANVAAATHGESVVERLGSGDAGQAFQRFTLARPPTTHVSAASASGATSTLAVRVNGILWQPRPSLYGAAPEDHVYTTRIADDARMQVLFGDGHQGARLPSALAGQLNVEARYRTGIGPDGEVAAGTLTLPRALPLGLRGVTNPLPASGAQGPDRLDDARRNATLTLMAFERVVALPDYRDFARAFPGIGKARADLAVVAGAQRVLVSVAGATGGAPGEQVVQNLRAAIAAQSDPGQAFVLAPVALRYFRCAAALVVHARHEAAVVLAAARASMLQAFGFDARDIAQPVTAAELLAVLHQVPGVLAVDLDLLQPYGEGAPLQEVAQVVPALPARWDAVAHAVQPAALLLVNPAAIEIREATP